MDLEIGLPEFQRTWVQSLRPALVAARSIIQIGRDMLRGCLKSFIEPTDST